MAYCEKCGTQIKAGAKFCEKCGAPVKGIAPGKKGSEGSVKKTVALGIGIGAAAAVVVVVGICFAAGVIHLPGGRGDGEKEIAQTVALKEETGQESSAAAQTEQPEQTGQPVNPEQSVPKLTEQPQSAEQSQPAKQPELTEQPQLTEQPKLTEQPQSASAPSAEDTEGETDGYLFEDSDSRYLTKKEVKKLSKAKLRLARNELYARHGYIFSDKGLAAYFEKKSWYMGTIAREDFKDSDFFNKYEIANRNLILKYERKKK